jgi:OmcA/MtrC family decaheme c-type cytochrome
MRVNIALALLAAVFLIAGCGGGGGGGGGAPPPEFVIPAGDTSAVTTAQEACAGCHNDAGGVPVTEVHAILGDNATQYDPYFTSIDLTVNQVTVFFSVDDRDGNPVNTLTSQDVRFTFLQLVTGAGGEPEWDNYFKSSGEPTYQRANANPGAFVNNGDGTYAYTFGGSSGATTFTGLTGAATPIRIGMQVENGVSNGWWDLTANAGPLFGSSAAADGYGEFGGTWGTPHNYIVDTDNCNKCHAAQGDRTTVSLINGEELGSGLGFHGGTRREVQYCISCHNPDLPNQDLQDDGVASNLPGGENLDLKTLVHKLHLGKGLESVDGRSSGSTVIIAGGEKYYVGSHDYSGGGFPQPIQNCEKCHVDTAWQDNPSIEACSTCHDRTWFGTLATRPTVKDAKGNPRWRIHSGGEDVLNGGCNGCHPASGAAGGGISVASAHTWGTQLAKAANYAYLTGDVGVVTTRVSGLFPIEEATANLRRVGTTLPAINAIASADTTATITFDSDHAMLDGATITVSGATETAFNGTFVVTYVDTDQVSYTIADQGGASATGSPKAVRKAGELQVTFQVNYDAGGDPIFSGSPIAIEGTLPAVSSITASGTTATITFGAVHGLGAGDRINVQGASQSQYNGRFTVATVPNTTTATYTMSSAPTVSPATVQTGASAIIAGTGPFSDHGPGSGGGSTLNLKIGWKGSSAADYTNEGGRDFYASLAGQPRLNSSTPYSQDKTPGVPVSVNLLCPFEARPEIDCSSTFYRVVETSTPNVYVANVYLPSSVTSGKYTGIAMIDGHPAEPIAGAKNKLMDIRLPVETPYVEFGMRDAVPDMRRMDVVDADPAGAGCANCHDSLSLHGQNRTTSGAYGLVICTVCHNSANTDLARRPAKLSDTDDNKAEEAIDLKYMLHRIHKGRDSTDGFIQIFGFGGSKNTFAGEFPPGNDLNFCENCHQSGKYSLPLASGLQGTTVDSGTLLSDHSDDKNISPNSSVCNGCHDSPAAMIHMQVMGGNFEVKESDIEFY